LLFFPEDDPIEELQRIILKEQIDIYILYLVVVQFAFLMLVPVFVEATVSPFVLIVGVFFQCFRPKYFCVHVELLQATK